MEEMKSSVEKTKETMEGKKASVEKEKGSQEQKKSPSKNIEEQKEAKEVQIVEKSEIQDQELPVGLQHVTEMEQLHDQFQKKMDLELANETITVANG